MDSKDDLQYSTFTIYYIFSIALHFGLDIDGEWILLFNRAFLILMETFSFCTSTVKDVASFALQTFILQVFRTMVTKKTRYIHGEQRCEASCHHAEGFKVQWFKLVRLNLSRQCVVLKRAA